MQTKKGIRDQRLTEPWYHVNFISYISFPLLRFAFEGRHLSLHIKVKKKKKREKQLRLNLYRLDIVVKSKKVEWWKVTHYEPTVFSISSSILKLIHVMKSLLLSLIYNASNRFPLFTGIRQKVNGFETDRKSHYPVIILSWRNAYTRYRLHPNTSYCVTLDTSMTKEAYINATCDHIIISWMGDNNISTSIESFRISRYLIEWNDMIDLLSAKWQRIPHITLVEGSLWSQ